MIDFPQAALLIAGFALAHAAWSVSDLPETELLVPLAVVEHSGQRHLARFEAATQEAAIARGKAAMAADHESEAWAFAREGTWRAKNGAPSQDVLVVGFWARGMRAPATLVQPFRRAADAAHPFRLIDAPWILDADGHQLPDVQAEAARTSLLHGVMSHSAVAPLWATWQSQ
jgi:hypothetical protein